jgi:hypothetical protein
MPKISGSKEITYHKRSREYTIVGDHLSTNATSLPARYPHSGVVRNPSNFYNRNRAGRNLPAADLVFQHKVANILKLATPVPFVKLVG